MIRGGFCRRCGGFFDDYNAGNFYLAVLMMVLCIAIADTGDRPPFRLAGTTRSLRDYLVFLRIIFSSAKAPEDKSSTLDSVGSEEKMVGKAV